MAVRVEIESEAIMLNWPARIFVYENDRLVVEVVGTIEKRKGADGRYYPCIILKQTEIISERSQG